MNRELLVEPEVLARLARLPILPVAAQVLEVARAERVPVQGLADVIGSDTTLAARLLRLVNWAPGVNSRLVTVAQAIAHIGVENIKGLVLGLTSFPFDAPASECADATGSDVPVNVRQLWEHMLGCAIVAGRIANDVDSTFAQQAFVAGFLHDVGRVLLHQHWRNSFFEAMTMAREKQIPPAEAETLVLGRNHLEIGGHWAHTCSLNPLLSSAIGQHHLAFPSLTDLDEPQRKFIAVVQLADLLCEMHGVGKGCDAAPIKDELWEALKLARGDWSKRVEAVKREVEMSRPLFRFQLDRRVQPMPLREVAAATKKEKNGKARVIPFPYRPQAPSDQSAKGTGRKLTILIVEDHGSLCDMLSLYFMRYGYHVRTASDGESALSILDNEEIHLVLLDLMLPRIDGFAVLRQIRERGEGKHPYVIVVSAGASTKDRSRVLELGANEYMPKPFHLMRLLERIQNVEKYLLR